MARKTATREEEGEKGWMPKFCIRVRSNHMVWAYIKVILAPPGNTCDYVPKTPQPLFPRAQWDAAQDAYGYDSAESYDSCTAALTDIETGRIGGPLYEELAIALPAHVPGAANGSVPETSMPNGSGHAPTPAPPPRRKSSRRSRGRRRDNRDRDGGRDRDGRIPRGRTYGARAAWS
ncbi:hypothetical protein B0H13DRAFT_1895474 [Mycena leptocephala]|nr:hypothetical protein B0H13DRAFT_1895474 [Mycena leptocephala]